MKIGFVGLGAMGRPMAASLQRAGHELQVHDLRRVEGFPNQKRSVTEAAQDCEVLFTSLPGPAEVEAVASGIKMKIGQLALDELAEAMKRGWSERDCRVAMTLQEERAGVSVRVAPQRLKDALD